MTTHKQRINGDRFGTHRVISNSSIKILPQQAEKLDASLPIYENELLIDVEALNVDSASFHQIRKECVDNVQTMQTYVMDLVKKQGKHQNPVTGSGGVLVGSVKEVGHTFLEGKHPSENVKIGDRITTLISLTLTPLELYKIKKIYLERDRIDVDGHAILFQSGIYAKLPSDIPEMLAMAVLDVCGAPAQTRLICKPGQTVVIMGGAGKSGLLCLYEAKKAVGNKGRVIALDYGQEAIRLLKNLSFVDEAHFCDARDAIGTYETVKRLTQNKMADVVINVTNIPETEMACILSVRPQGLVYFFSMATSFTKAALGAEGVRSDATLMIGNGYCPGHAELTLNILRESPEIRTFYEKKYGSS